MPRYVTIPVLVLILLLAGYTVLIFLPDFYLHQLIQEGLVTFDSSGGLIDSKAKLINETRNSLLQFLGGFALLFGAVVTWQQFQNSVRQQGDTTKANLLSDLSRYTEKLDATSSAAIVAGLYGLERVAEADESQIESILDILAVWVKEQCSILDPIKQYSDIEITFAVKLILRLANTTGVTKQINLTDCNLSEMCLEGKPDKFLSLMNIQFFGCQLDKCHFKYCNFDNCDFRRTKSQSLVFESCDILHSPFDNMVFKYLTFYAPCKISDCTFQGCEGEMMNACDCDLSKITIFNTDVIGCLNLEHSRISSSFFEVIKSKEIVFSDCKLFDTVIDTKRVDQVYFGRTALKECEVSGTDIVETYWGGAELNKVDLYNCRWFKKKHLDEVTSHTRVTLPADYKEQ